MTTQTLTLADFLLARIAEDERAQNGSIGDQDWHEFRCDINRLHPETKASFPCDCGVPARVVAECEAKRRILELHRDTSGLCDSCAGLEDYESGERFAVPAPCPTLQLLALPYADHPDFRDEWRA